MCFIVDAHEYFLALALVALGFHHVFLVPVLCIFAYFPGFDLMHHLCQCSHAINKLNFLLHFIHGYSVTDYLIMQCIKKC